MIISSDDLREEFKKFWPKLEHIWLRNPKYYVPTTEMLRQSVRDRVFDLPIIRDFNECENFALFLHAEIKKEWVLSNPKRKANWAFGDFIARKQSLLGEVSHTACICLTQETFYVIEPMEKNRMERIDPEQYNIFFVNMY